MIPPKKTCQDAFPPDFKQSSLDDLNGMVGFSSVDVVWACRVDCLNVLEVGC